MLQQEMMCHLTMENIDMSISKFYKESIGWMLGGGHQSQHKQMGIYKQPMRCVALGDSITNGSSDHVNGVYGSNVYWNVMQWQSGAQIVFVRNAGFPSQPSSTIVNRFFDEVLPYRPDAMFLMQGTNDVSSITGSGQFTYAIVAAAMLANEAACISAALGSGIIPVIVAVPPRGISSSPQSAFATYTKALNVARGLQAQAMGAIYVDIWTPLADPINLWYNNTTWTPDGVHPSPAAAQIIASTILASIPTLLAPTSRPRAIIRNDTASPFSNPLFFSTGGTQADQTTFYGTIAGKTTSIVSDTFANGNWYRISWPAGTATTSAYLDSSTTPITQFRGKKVAFSGRLRTSGMAASGSLVGIKVLFYNAAGASISPSIVPINGSDFSLDSPGGISGQGGVFYMEQYVPASAATVKFQIQYTPGSTGSGTVYSDIAEFVMYDIRYSPGFVETRSSKSPRRILVVSANYVVNFDDDLILVNAAAGSVVITLPPVNVNSYTTNGQPSYGIGLPGSGSQYEIIKTDSSANSVTITAGSGDNIQGSSTQLLSTQWAKTTVCAIDSNLWINV